MFFLKHLSPAHFLSVAISAVLFAPSVGAGNTCSDVEPQPIGIDFADIVVTASYAYTQDNITYLAGVIVDDEAYTNHMFRLRMEEYRQSNRSRIHASMQPPDGIGQMLMAIGQPYLERLLIHMPFQGHPIVTAIRDSGAVTWVRNVSKQVFNAAKLGASSKTWKDDMTPENIKDGFVTALKLLKEQVLETHDINITFAILSVPDIFNQTVNAIVQEACAEVGIETMSPFKRSMIGAWGAQNAPDARVLVLDHGKFHLVMRSYQEVTNRWKPISQMSFPVDFDGSAKIDRQIVAQVIITDDVLRNQIALGASKSQLQGAIERARILIKDNFDELMARDNEDKHIESPHHEEWPLDLRDWWIGEEQSAVLRWEDVQRAEDKYVEDLSDIIYKFLVFIRRKREMSNDEHVGPEDIDVAVVMTNQMDGGLLKLAVQRALGREVETKGVSLKSHMLAADGAARVAFKRLESWKQTRRYNQNYEEPFGHNEL